MLQSVSTLRLLALSIALLSIPASLAITDVEIFQFALNLEYLEANFYSCAAFGRPIPADLWGEGGVAPAGCMKASLSPAVELYAEAISKDETAHVAFLRKTLAAAKVTPVSQPALNIGAAFGLAADAALNATLMPPFSPYGDDALFYLGSFIFEDVGATAYHGALPLIMNKNYLVAAAGIMGVESYHAATIRTALVNYMNTAIFPYGATVNTVINSIAALRDAAGGTHIDSGIVDSTGMSTLVPTDANSILYSRTPAEVLKIVYLGGTSSGGFFPKGLNGAITSAA